MNKIQIIKDVRNEYGILDACHPVPTVGEFADMQRKLKAWQDSLYKKF